MKEEWPVQRVNVGKEMFDKILANKGLQTFSTNNPFSYYARGSNGQVNDG
jgi:hypothetical protein